MKKPVFAVDVGGVLASKQHDGEPMPGVREGLIRLYDKFDLQIVSMCGRNRALKTREWLDHYALAPFFSHQTYIGFEHRNKDKVLREIDAEYFVDDRAKHVRPALMLPRMKKVYHLCPREEAVDTFIRRYVWVSGWDNIIERTRGLPDE